MIQRPGRGIALALTTLVAVSSLAAGPPAGGSLAVPAVPLWYRLLHGYLSATLSGLEKYLDRQPTPARKPVWSAELLTANGNRCEQLLAPTAMDAVRLFLDRFQAIGFRSVSVSVCYPLLAPTFPHHAQYEAFFRDVAAEVRRRGLMLEVETGTMFANTAFASASIDYRSMTFAQIVEGRRAHVAAVVAAMHPDWLDIGAEPDTEATLTGHPEMNDPDRRVEMVRAILRGLDRGRTKMAAGIGSWGDLRFVEAFLGHTSLDAIAIHIYPISKKIMSTAALAARMARKAGKEVLLDECWLYKAGPFEAQGTATTEKIYRRDYWSFWAPLDCRFLAAMDLFARQEDIAFISPFWSHQYFVYLDYDPAGDRQDYKTLNAAYIARVGKALLGGTLSATGEAMKALVAR